MPVSLRSLSTYLAVRWKVDGPDELTCERCRDHATGSTPYDTDEDVEEEDFAFADDLENQSRCTGSVDIQPLQRQSVVIW